MARTIRLLDEATVNKIAAGEVIERPASVVKELVENSIDADASQIAISVVDGGRGVIRARDNGRGMSREDVEACLERHATSKLAAIDDLAHLSSFGFRGEALSSVAAVSRVTLRTREHGASEGTQLVARAGTRESLSVCGCPEGTEVLVEELFFNLPARKKSLKSKGIELGHCRDVVLNYMLSRPDISFSFDSEGHPELSHIPAEGIEGVLVAAFGTKEAGGMVAGEAEGRGYKVRSRLSRLEHTRSSPSDLRVFVDGRPVKHAKVISAVIEGYGSRLMKDRYPMGLVEIRAGPDMVDVNVHPTKREVRFADEPELLKVVTDCVRSSFEGPDLSFKYDLTGFSERFEPLARPLPVDSRGTTQTTLEVARGHDRRLSEGAPIVPLAQVMNTYILAETSGSLVLIDQHAASERVMYEELLRNMKSGPEIHQKLLTPVVLDLTATERRTLEEHRLLLERLGFVLEPFGGESFALRSVPTVLGVAQIDSELKDILGDIASSEPKKMLGLDVIWRVACHTAIRAGEPLSQAQMRQLVMLLMRTENPYTCEHGRPTMVTLSSADLERLFKRRV